jgi:hypothetical protein
LSEAAKRLRDEGDKSISLDTCGLVLLVTGAGAGAVTYDLRVAYYVSATHNDGEGKL